MAETGDSAGMNIDCQNDSPTVGTDEDRKLPLATTLHQKPKPESFVITFDDSPSIEPESLNLQDAFRRYRKERQNEYKKSISPTKQRSLVSDEEKMWKLRMKFLNQAKKYFGVPYARKYWCENDPEYQSPIFLDCCALVRRVLRDLKKEFGFKIGPWNQSYQYDTLPIVIENLEDVRPGDLVFISATYNSKRSKKQRHDLTHVEIMLGDGTPRTIGARWQKGKVQIFESYAFEAKSYHTPTYTFKSIDTWLTGECKTCILLPGTWYKKLATLIASHCPQHEWMTRREKRLKRLAELKQKKMSSLVFEDERSIFSRESDDEENYCANDTDEELVLSAEDDTSLRMKLDECLGQLGNTGQLENEEPKLSIKEGRLEDEEGRLENEEGRLEDEEGELEDEEGEFESEEEEFVRDKFEVSGSVVGGDRRLGSAATSGGGCLELDPDLDLLTLSSAVSSVSIETSVTDQSESALPKRHRDVINNRTSLSADLTYDVIELELSDGMGCSLNDVISIATSGYGHFVTSQSNMAALNLNTSAIPAEISVSQCSCEDTECCHQDFNVQLIDLSQQICSGPIENAVIENGVECENPSANQEPADNKLPNQREATNNQSSTNGKATNQREACDTATNQRLVLPSVTSSPAKLYQTERVSRNNTFVTPPGTRRRDEPVTKPKTMATENPVEAPKRSQSPVEKDKATGDNGDGTPKRVVKRRQSLIQLASNQIPVYYIGGGNGNALIDGPLSKLGWKRTMEKTDDFRLKWTECKSNISYNSFKEGEQMVNHIPNGSAMTNKLGLYNSLKEYDRVLTNTRKKYYGILMRDFYPETFNLDDRPDREAFLETYKDGEIWICKPTGMNQGKGIYLVRTLDEIRKVLLEREERQQSQNASKRLMGRIIQRYLPTPLLLEGKKFDVRTYMAITSTVPFMVFYHQGYCRLSIQNYCKDSEDLKIHLTNQYIQKRDPNYKEIKDETVWSMERLNEYINKEVAPKKGLSPDWVNTVFVKQTQRIMLHLFKAVKNKLGNKVGFFELYGLDFMIDHDMKIYLIEVNVNPSLATNCEMLKAVIPQVVEETLAISIETFDKCRRNHPILPLKNLKNFVTLYSERSTSTRVTSPERMSTDRRQSNASPGRYRDRGVSPPKETKPTTSPFTRPLSLPKIPSPFVRAGATSNPATVRRPMATRLIQMDARALHNSNTTDTPIKLKMTSNEETQRKPTSDNRGN